MDSQGYMLILKNPRLASSDSWVPLREVTVAGEAIRVPPVLTGDGESLLHHLGTVIADGAGG